MQYVLLKVRDHAFSNVELKILKVGTRDEILAEKRRIHATRRLWGWRLVYRRVDEYK